MTESEIFEGYYVRAREKESRLYTDDQVKALPDIPAGHLYYQEWQIRKRSAEKLLQTLSNQNQGLSVLEIGCGNGWLAYQLSRLPGSRVTGLDINTVELQQGRRVFRQQQNLRFIAGDIRSGLLQGQQFDRIIFAAAIQYFPSLGEILQVAFDHLTEKGEIHILDSFFYEKKELAAARQRTAAYYLALGIPEMDAYYFHHAMEDLAPYHYQIVNRRSWLAWLISGRERVFPWIKIMKSKVSP